MGVCCLCMIPDLADMGGMHLKTFQQRRRRRLCYRLPPCSFFLSRDATSAVIATIVIHINYRFSTDTEVHVHVRPRQGGQGLITAFPRVHIFHFSYGNFLFRRAFQCFFPLHRLPSVTNGAKGRLCADVWLGRENRFWLCLASLEAWRHPLELHALPNGDNIVQMCGKLFGEEIKSFTAFGRKLH